MRVLGSSPTAATADGGSAGNPPPGTADRGTMEQQLHALREKAEQLEKQGKHDEAERLKHDAYELYKKFRATYPATTSAPTTNPERQKVYGQLRELSQKISQLEKDGKHDEAERLRKEARELYTKLNPNASSAPPLTGPSPERKALYEQYKTLHEKIEAAKKAGNQDEVKRLMAEVEGVRAKLFSQEGRPAGYSTGGDRAARMQHLRTAFENLKAAGCEPEAQHVMEMIRRMEAEGRSYEGRPGPSTTAPTTSGRPYYSGDTATTAMMQELRGQVEQMRREMREMREELNRARVAVIVNFPQGKARAARAGRS